MGKGGRKLPFRRKNTFSSSAVNLALSFSLLQVFETEERGFVRAHYRGQARLLALLHQVKLQQVQQRPKLLAQLPAFLRQVGVDHGVQPC